MDIQTLTAFFMWATIIDAGLLIFSIVMFMAMPDFVYGVHSKMFPMTREAYDIAIYSFLGLFKILFIVFNLVPYVALLIIS